MRFSPTLLACCTVATFFGLPVFAADVAASVEALAEGAAVPSDDVVGPEDTVGLPSETVPLDGATPIAQQEEPTETPEEALERLLEGIGQPPEPAPDAEPAP
ncbi:MAG: hypothetical protein AAGI45_21420, partial [Cyanobacteria bacterium P01_H01_bin.26]